MKVGIIGFPQSGKKTVFETLTAAETPANSFGQQITQIISVPEPRIVKLAEIFNPKKTVFAQLEFNLFPSLEDANEGKRKGTLATVSSMDLLAFVIGAQISNDPAEVVKESTAELKKLTETFILSDMVIIDDKLTKAKLDKRKGLKTSQQEVDLLERCHAVLDKEDTIRNMEFTGDEEKIIRNYQFLSQKPLIAVINVNENMLGSAEIHDNIESLIKSPKTSCAVICGAVERDIAFMDETDRPEFLQTYNIEEPAFHLFIRECYRLLRLQSFFTVGEDECRAWTIKAGSDAPSAAGVIHSDLQRGFIRAETISYDDFMTYKSMAKAKEAGKFALKGKDYIVQDGDILNIRFNV